MRKLLLALAAIVVFGVGSMLVVYFATEPGSRAPSAPPPAPAPTVADLPAPATTLARPLVPPVPLQQPGPPVVYAPLPPKPPEGSWEAVTPVARPSELGPVGAAIGRGLNELHSRLSACFDAPPGRQAPVTAVKDAAPADDHGVTVLVLEVETLAGRVRIVDAPVETYGGASEGVIACAQGVLRGALIPAPQARPGARHRILFTLTQ